MLFDGDEEDRLRSVVLTSELILVGCDAKEDDALGTEADGRWLVLPFFTGWSLTFEVELLLARDRAFVTAFPAPAPFDPVSGSLCKGRFWLVFVGTAEAERFVFELRLSRTGEGAPADAAPDGDGMLPASSTFDSLSRFCLSVAA